MTPLSSAQGLLALRSMLQGRPLVALDFDGTLAPLVDDPQVAAVPHRLAAKLVELAALLPVAVITGRDAEDVGARLGFTASAIVGNHGADHWLPRPDSLESWYSAVQWLRDRAQWLALWGVQVEFKQCSLALHYRQANDSAQALRAIQSCLAVAPAGWESFGGACVINLVPEGAPSKADAVLELMARWACTSCIYVGDDINDEPVFRADIAGLLSVRVGMSEDSAAEYGLAGHDDVQYLIDLMLEFRNAASTAP